jgi:hypothetical protein
VDVSLDVYSNDKTYQNANPMPHKHGFKLLKMRSLNVGIVMFYLAEKSFDQQSIHKRQSTYSQCGEKRGQKSS